MKIDHFGIATLAESDDITCLVNAAYRPDSTHAGWTHESNLISGARTSSEQIIEIINKKDSIILVAIQDSKLSACVHIERTDHHCSIGMLAVSPAFQDAGLGKKMLGHAETFAIKHFSAQRLIMIVLSARYELISFYQRRGYRKTGNVLEYPISAGVGSPKFDNLKIEMLEKILNET